MKSKRVLKNLQDIGYIGRNKDGGIDRVAFSKCYFQALDELETLFKSSGLETYRDGVGNLYGKRSGKSKVKKTIMVGSHLDTVKNGGLYDGLLGIIAGLEVVNILNEIDYELSNDLIIVAFNAEEGSELGGTFGSRVVSGRQDIDEETIKKLSIYSLNEDSVKSSVIDKNSLKGFIELHVEQGKTLDSQGINIGIVEGILGLRRYRINIIGEANHAGTTLMSARKDAMVAASKIILKVEEYAIEIGNPFVATVGHIEVKPNSVNVVPGEVNLDLELRDISSKNLDNFMLKLTNYFKTELKDFRISENIMIDKPHKHTDGKLNSIMENVCKHKKYQYKRMYSAAGHDAKEMAYITPTTMVFVPSKDGISHSPYEFTDINDIMKGIDVLFNMIKEIDKVVEE